MSLFAELKRRNVLRMAAGYVVLSWLLIQIADTLGDTLELPVWTGKFVIMLVALGFLPALFFSWVYELTPDGLKRESEVALEDSVTAHTGRKLDVAVIVLLLLAIGLFSIDRIGVDPPLPASPSTAATTPPTRATATEPESTPNNRRSVAVLPFTNRSAESDTAYFVDGVHDDLLTQLAKIGNLKVISRTSVMEYRDTTKNLRQIGEELGVATIMEGAVQRSGDRVRINAQLIDAISDEHLWAETFDRELTAASIFDIQTEIARAIAQALQATLTSQDEARLGRRLTDNLEALAAYQRAKALDDATVLADQDRVEIELQAALRLDPEFVAAWAFLARTKLSRWWIGIDDPALRDQAREAIDTARALDPDSPELRIAEGYYHYWGFRRYQEALKVLEPALQDYPNDADLHEVIAFVNRRFGQFDKALEHLLIAQELNPRSVNTLWGVGETYYNLRDFENVRKTLNQLEQLAPTASSTYALRGQLLMAMGRADAAADQIQLAVREVAFMRVTYWYLLTASGRFRQALSVSDLGDVSVSQNHVALPTTNRGLTYLLSGDREQAQVELEKGLEAIDAALAERPHHYGYLKARCKSLGALRADGVEAACATALEYIYDDAFDRYFEYLELAAGLALGGANEAALDLIEEALAARAGPTKAFTRIDPRLAGLHVEPRWQALIGEGS